MHHTYCYIEAGGSVAHSLVCFDIDRDDYLGKVPMYMPGVIVKWTSAIACGYKLASCCKRFSITDELLQEGEELRHKMACGAIDSESDDEGDEADDDDNEDSDEGVRQQQVFFERIVAEAERENEVKQEAANELEVKSEVSDQEDLSADRDRQHQEDIERAQNNSSDYVEIFSTTEGDDSARPPPGAAPKANSSSSSSSCKEGRKRPAPQELDVESESVSDVERFIAHSAVKKDVKMINDDPIDDNHDERLKLHKGSILDVYQLTLMRDMFASNNTPYCYVTDGRSGAGLRHTEGCPVLKVINDNYSNVTHVMTVEAAVSIGVRPCDCMRTASRPPSLEPNS
jgi:hypothetical protein